MQQQKLHVIFLIVQSHGTPIRTFIVPVGKLMDEWSCIEPLLGRKGDFAFDDRENHRTLWLIGQRLGVVQQGTESPDLAKYEQFGNCGRADICAYLIGTVDH